MRAVVLDAPYNFRLEEKPLPALEPGWALVEVRAAGICGSDIHFYTGEIPPEPGSVRGHEIAGVVVEPGAPQAGQALPDAPQVGQALPKVGQALPKVGQALPKVGQAVVVHPLLGCGTCAACQRGDVQLCIDLQAIGGQYAGGFAEYVAVPVGSLYAFDADRLSFRHAALADGVAVAVHAMNAVDLKPGESAVILGDGTVGLLLLQAALARGADPVLLVGKHELNLQVARQLGASHTLDSASEDVLDTVQELAGQVDVVFEAVGGLAPPLGMGLKMLRKGGRLAMLGLTGARQVDVPWLEVVFGELSLAGVMGYGRRGGQDEMQQALDLMQAGQVLLEPIITHCYPLPEVERGFEAMLNRASSRCIKAVIVPTDSES